jgi:hypothetical protein
MMDNRQFTIHETGKYNQKWKEYVKKILSYSAISRVVKEYRPCR